jgi:hypothetical protein
MTPIEREQKNTQQVPKYAIVFHNKHTKRPIGCIESANRRLEKRSTGANGSYRRS